MAKRKNRPRREPRSFPSKYDNSKIHKEFIALNWDLFAAGAWAGYQAEGRGFMMINAEHARFRRRWEEGSTPGAYISKKAMLDEGILWEPPAPEERGSEHTRADQEIAWRVDMYEPETQIVVAIFRKDGGVSVYRVGAQGPLPTPPEALKRMGPHFKEFMMTDEDLKAHGVFKPEEDEDES